MEPLYTKGIVTLLVLCVAMTEARFSWFESYFKSLRQAQQRAYPTFPISTTRYSPLPQKFGFDPVSGKLLGFDPAPFNFHAGKPAATTPAKEDLPVPTMKPNVNDNKPEARTSIPEEGDVCASVICPQGTMCTTHASQCAQPPCSDMAECTKIRDVDACKKPLARGNCAFEYKSFYYDADLAKCLPFVYTGCGGNDNRFTTLEQCQQVCIPNKKLCHLAQESGPCRAAKPRWYFNQINKTCMQYIYGGCRGNSNNFETQAECLRVCSEE